MDVEVNEALKLAMSVIVFALVVAIAVSFINLTQTVRNDTEKKTAIVKEMTAYKTVAALDNKEVTSGDIVDTMVRFNKDYEYTFVLISDESLVVNYKDIQDRVETDTTEGIAKRVGYGNYWSHSDILNDIGGLDGNRRFTSELKYSMYGHLIGFTFTEID